MTSQTTETLLMYENELCSQGVGVKRLTVSETLNIQRRWLEIYGSGVPRDIELSNRKGFDWHVFSYELCFALRGRAAVEAFGRTTIRNYIVLPHTTRHLREEMYGFLCTSTSAPRLEGHGDVYIIASDFSWVMAYTHEDDTGSFGPYFSRREWVTSPPVQSAPKNRRKPVIPGDKKSRRR